MSELRKNKKEEGLFNILVEGFASTVQEFDLSMVFSRCGEIKSVKIIRSETGLSEGYGYITFNTLEAQRKAIMECNGMRIKDRVLIVKETKAAKEERKRQSDTQTYPIFIGSIPSTITESSLSSIFSQFGPVTSTKIMKSKKEDKRLYGFVNFLSKESMEAALNQKQLLIKNGNILNINPSNSFLSKKEKNQINTNNINKPSNILPTNIANIDNIKKDTTETISNKRLKPFTDENNKDNDFNTYRNLSRNEDFVSLCIENLPSNVSNNYLQTIIEKKSKTPITQILIRKGFCFVNYKTSKDALYAFKNLKGSTICDKNILVFFTKNIRKTKPHNSIIYLEERALRTAFLQNIRPDTTKSDIIEKFKRFGKINNISVGKKKNSTDSRLFAFIEFDNEIDALTAVRTFDQTIFQGQNIRMHISYVQNSSKSNINKEPPTNVINNTKMKVNPNETIIRKEENMNKSPININTTTSPMNNKQNESNFNSNEDYQIAFDEATGKFVYVVYSDIVKSSMKDINAVGNVFSDNSTMNIGNMSNNKVSTDKHFHEPTTDDINKEKNYNYNK